MGLLLLLLLLLLFYAVSVFVALTRFISFLCQLCGTCANQWQLHPNIHVVTPQWIQKKWSIYTYSTFQTKEKRCYNTRHNSTNYVKQQFFLCLSIFLSPSSVGWQLMAKPPFAARPFTQQNKILTRCQFLTAGFNNIGTSWCLTPCSLIEVLSFLRKAKSKPSGYKRLKVPLAAESSFTNDTYLPNQTTSQLGGTYS